MSCTKHPEGQWPRCLGNGLVEWPNGSQSGFCDETLELPPAFIAVGGVWIAAPSK